MIDKDTPPSNVTDALLRKLEAAKKAERVRDDVGYGILMTALWARVEQDHISSTAQQLHDMGAILDAIEVGLKALEGAKIPGQDLVVQRCEEALRYAMTMTEYSRPNSIDRGMKELRLGKIQFYKRVVDLQVRAVKLLETYTMLSLEMGKGKHEQLMDVLVKLGLITRDAREIVTEKRYPKDSSIVEISSRMKK